MKIFISYRFTGENLSELKSILGKINEILKSKGHDIFCSLNEEEYFKSRKLTVDEIYEYCNQKLEEYDTILFFIKSEEKSKGMEMELEKAIKHNKRIIVAIKKNIYFSRFCENAHEIIKYTDLENLYALLSKRD